jgi:NADH-quinone oxidoreductase subunit M
MTDFLASIGYTNWIIPALLLVPTAGIVPILMAPAAQAKRVALGVSTGVFVLSLGLWWAFDPSSGNLQMVTAAPWMSFWGIYYRVGIDGISLFMVLLSTGMMPLAVLGSWRYITKAERGYYALLLVMTSGMIGVFVSLDLFLFYVFWELILIPMYFIIGVWGGPNRLYAAIKFFIYTMFGSLLMLFALLFMVWEIAGATGILSFEYAFILSHTDVLTDHATWYFAAFALAFAIKVPMVPFHTWLPDAHTEAPTAGSVLLAAVLLKMGTYGFLRFAVPFFPEVAMSPVVSALFVTLAVIGIVHGALVAMVQPDAKRLVAYSSVSHMGFAVLGIWAATVQSVQGALMVMIGHGLATGALFFLVGMLYERRHSRLFADFGGLARVLPLFSLALTVAALASIGLPGLSGFVGEFLVLLGSFEAHPWATVIATTGVIFAAAYMLWAVQRIIYNPLVAPENKALEGRDLDMREYLVVLPLMVGMLWLGLYPKPVLRRMEAAAARYVETTIPSTSLVRTGSNGSAPEGAK